MYSFLIKNGTVIDGTGKAAYKADVALDGDQIVAIGSNIPEKGARVIDAQERIVAPGFVDIQNHSDSYWSIFDNPSFDSMVTQGFTSILVGQCGASLAPLLSPASLLSIRKWHDLSGSNINWTTFSEYIEELSRNRFGCNIATLVGYATLRRGLLGDEVRSLEKNELDTLKAQLADSLDAGAFGLSNGLSYSHEMYTSELELQELVSLVVAKGGLLSIHLRNEAEEILESLEEALEIAKVTGVNMKIAHLKIRNRSNWQLMPQVIERLETAFHKGLNVHFDAYPYDSVWQVIYSYLPKWSRLGGRSAILNRLEDAHERKKLANELAEQSHQLSMLVVASTGNQLGMVGKTVADISKNTGLSVEEVFIELLKNAGSESLVFDRSADEAQVYELLSHPLAIVGTDGAGFKEVANNFRLKEKLVHPRCFGAAPKFLRHVIDTKVITLEEAIKKLTLTPATKIGLAKRGALAVGNFADVVVFNPVTVSDNATLSNPFQYSTGIEHVFVNGKQTLSGGIPTQHLAGYMLRKK